MAIRGLDAGQRPALLINECQRGTTDPTLAALPQLANEVERRGTIERIAWLAGQFRAHGLPVVHCTVVHRAGYEGVPINCSLVGAMRRLAAFVEGGADTEIHPVLAPEPSDFVIPRGFGLTSWYPTALDAILRNLGVGTIVLTGVSTNIAIPTTAVEAVGRGYSVVIPEDATAGTTPEIHDLMVSEILPISATISTAAEVAAALD